jgi:hypothetical protein
MTVLIMPLHRGRRHREGLRAALQLDRENYQQVP